MKTTIQRVYFVVLILFFCIIEQLNASSINTYFFAYGQEEEINIFWDYCGEENLLGCHLLRSETFGGEYLPVNDSILTSPDNVFSFQDTTSIIDTLYYFYRINYVLHDSTFTDLSPISSLKQVTFEVVNEECVDMFLEMRKNKAYLILGYVSWDNYIWDELFEWFTTDSVTFSINPYNYIGDYLLLSFTEIGQIPLWLGEFKVSMDYLISIIIGSDIKNEIIPESTNILYQNFPNPFNPETSIYYELPVNVVNPVIEIFNIKGEKVKNLECGESLTTKADGVGYSISWDGTDNHRKQVSSGVYLYRLKSDEGVLMSKKMLLLR